MQNSLISPDLSGWRAFLSLADDEALGRLEAIGQEMAESGATNVRVSILQAIDRQRPLGGRCSVFRA
ncbi:hypothetical protein CM1200mP19_0170 [bacterium]|nr:MAG: hypothetical protein CM1200mP19_0170 [bacterium]